MHIVKTADIFLGLLAALTAPGFCLLAFLFPGKRDLSLVLRGALSCGLSALILCFAGFFLNYTPRGITFDSLATVLVVFTGTLIVAALLRKSLLKEDEGPVNAFPVLPTNSKVFFGAFLFMLISALVATCVTAPRISREEPYTEFFVLGLGGNVPGQTEGSRPGRQSFVTIRVVNHEDWREAYLVKFFIGGQLKGVYGPFLLDCGEQWSNKVVLPALSHGGKETEIAFLLFKYNQKVPCRELFIQMDANGGVKQFEPENYLEK